MATPSPAGAQQSQKPPTGLLDLAVETRLQIYRYVFASLHVQRCLYGIRRVDDVEPVVVVQVGAEPTGIPIRPSTSLLRTSRQIYNEALPILWETVEYRASDEKYRPALQALTGGKYEMGLSRLRSVVVSTAVPNSRSRLSMVPELSSFAAFMSLGLMQLREIRLHVDWFPASTADFHSLATRLAEGLSCILAGVDRKGVVVFIDIHGVCLRFDSEGTRRVKLMQRETVKLLREELRSLGDEGLRIEEWH